MTRITITLSEEDKVHQLMQLFKELDIDAFIETDVLEETIAHKRLLEFRNDEETAMSYDQLKELLKNTK